jgi:hypothetical protein
MHLNFGATLFITTILAFGTAYGADRCEFSAYQPLRFVPEGKTIRRSVVPEYPKDAMDRGIQGLVNVRVLFDANGIVQKACAISGDPLLRAAAESAALKTLFEPVLLNEKPVPYVELQISFNFVLPNDAKDSLRPEEDARFMDKCLQLTPGIDIYACYHSLMAWYACAAIMGGEAEKKAKNNMERFYKPLHNDTTIGIQTIYNKATELGCKAMQGKRDPKSETGFYIPNDLEGSIRELDSMLSIKAKNAIRLTSEEEVIDKYTLFIGMWLQNNWGLGHQSRLAMYFSKLRVMHPDSMSNIILQSYWRHLNEKPLKLDELVAVYVENEKRIGDD